ncbi:hypothetical protein NW754_012327 [Fusarium falciforme]|nr:hypothetical protein NW754_012327 [Fusarium falciforme]KAJ4204101.1 hypothetical protein NW767_004958 [Fusarium falciforme]
MGMESSNIGRSKADWIGLDYVLCRLRQTERHAVCLLKNAPILLLPFKPRPADLASASSSVVRVGGGPTACAAASRREATNEHTTRPWHPCCREIWWPSAEDSSTTQEKSKHRPARGHAEGGERPQTRQRLGGHISWSPRGASGPLPGRWLPIM